ncbi:MAG: response regulator transcription factor [Lachnospiraceae bacterium]|nr:response regulator transcription factor [Lachnospiraceae bacterium]
MHVFLVEDDEAIGMGLSYSLEKEGYDVSLVKTAADALSAWETGKFDICVLDINLPDGSGYDICKHIKKSEDVPVIFLTAVDAEVNVVMGLEIGADDYICKPFRVNEFMARVKSVLRRAGKTKKNGLDSEKNGYAERIENICIYRNEAKVARWNEVTGKEEAIDLTALEYRLFLTFLNNRGIVLSRNKLLSDMWDISGDFVNDNTLTVYIKRLRDKIEKDPTEPKIIRTVRGLGYICGESDK